MALKEKRVWVRVGETDFVLFLPPVICGWVFLLDYIILSCKIRKINLKLPSGSQVLWLSFLGAPEGEGEPTFPLFGKSPRK